MQTVLDGRYAADRSVVALGMFDGVHIGHQVLLKKGRALADRQGVPLVACTFMDHPLQLIAPDKCPPMLTTFDERVRLMESLGVDVFYAMPFDRSVMDMPPEDYVGHLVRQFHPTDVVCGYNHTFGKKGGGTPALLGSAGRCAGIFNRSGAQNHAEGTGGQLYRHSRLAAPGRCGPRAGVVGAPLSAPGGCSRSPGRALGAVYDAQRQAGCPQGKLPGAVLRRGAYMACAAACGARGTRPVQPACGYDPA